MLNETNELNELNEHNEKGGVTVKRIAVLVLLCLFVAGLVFISDDMAFAARAKDKEKKEEKVEETAPAAPTTAGKLIYTFKNRESMGEFEQLYVAKQATFGRMGVLQAYFAMEQNNLAEIDKQMDEKFGFKMDPNKMYDLNRDSLEIREVGPITSAEPAAAD